LPGPEELIATPPVEVLAVDSSSFHLFRLKSVLETVRLPHNMSIVHDGAQAVAFLKKEEPYRCAPTPDLIFVELDLPVMGGMEMLRRMPNCSLFPLCIAARSHDWREQAWEEFGIDAVRYLTKPVRAENVLTCLGQYPQFKEFVRRAETRDRIHIAP